MKPGTPGRWLVVLVDGTEETVIAWRMEIKGGALVFFDAYSTAARGIGQRGWLDMRYLGRVGGA